MTPAEIQGLDVYSEEFQNIFYPLLTRFVEEYEDMANMDIIRKAEALLKAINEA